MKLIENKKMIEIIEEFQKKFINNNINNKLLMWNNFIRKPILMSFDKIDKLNIKKNEDLYFFLERDNKLYLSNILEIKKFIESLEPWIDIDAYIFDITMLWTVAITHEDNLILYLKL